MTGFEGVRDTEVAPRRLTRTQRELLHYIGGETALNGGTCSTKRDLVKLTGRNVKTVDRGLAALRRDGLIEVEMRFAENGAQLSNWYRVRLPAVPSE
ncbi:hypothetical protein [Thermophilibacter provencensis]|uniref:Helix-turn-helix domain-containing protein n=1 Tax=Thermophilibacter provencensis TaxID=1852386 RepID=A0ABT7V431_9ACTN|nr:hypothetical protein [Thermophilibacter provencensis]MDM8271362.1 hypothetical protein [Thermophilibacter provencensis]